MYKLIILGGGPAGISAAIYAARKKIEAAIITDSFGGQSVVSDDIKNWIGEKSISGYDLGRKLEAHLKDQEGIDIIEGERAIEVRKNEDGSFTVKTESGKELTTATILVATGGRHRRLNIPGESKFEGKGVVFCATCDAPLFRNKEVAVIGAGNAGLEAVQDLIKYASNIKLLVRGDKIKGDPLTFEEIKKSEKVEIIYNAEPAEVLGETLVSGLKYKDLLTGEMKEISLQGIFVEIGYVPNSEMVKGLVDIDERGQIMIADFKTNQTSQKGIWAAGDVANTLYNQNNVAAGDATRAALNIYDYLKNDRQNS